MTSLPEPMRFDGPDYDPALDRARLTGQVKRVYDLMKDGTWRTLDEIAHMTDDPEASISAQLRHLRKRRFGGHTVNKQRRGDPKKGLFEYQLILNWYIDSKEEDSEPGFFRQNMNQANLF